MKTQKEGHPLVFLSVCLLALPIAGCGLIPSSMDVKHPRPPEVLLTQPIGVMPFKNDFEENSVTELTRSALSRARFNGRDVHDVVAADSLPNQTPKDRTQRKPNSPAKTLISGKIKRVESTNKTKTDEKVKVCAEEREAFQLDFDCDKYEEVHAPKIIRTYRLILYYKIDDLTRTGLEHEGKITSEATDSVVLKDQANHDLSITELLDDDPELESFESLSVKARRGLPDKLLDIITPYNEEIQADLLHPAESSRRYSFIEAAVNFADDGNIRRACRRFRKVYNSSIHTTVVLHNHGACREHDGDLDRAKELYSKARETATTDQLEVIEESIDRVTQAIEDRAIINETYPINLRK